MSTDVKLGIPSDVPPFNRNAKVFKDDCMYCYDTAENSKSGLDVCLTCYQAFSRGELNHTKQHVEESGHLLFLNIVKKLKPESERNFYLDENGERKLKLAKLEVRDLKDEELYDISYGIFESRSGETTPLEQTSSDLTQLAQDIINFNSASREDEIKVWEQDIVPCPHSVDIEQGEACKVDLSQCKMCDLTENLWICLTCGDTGCGREQFGSSLKGNTHALKHYNLTSHSVAVKLGSLNATHVGSYDAYCYNCNEEVKVFGIEEKLANWGIDLKSVKNWEKSLVELNLDQNLTWDFKLDGKDGEKLSPIYGSGLTGLQNLGNSCYLNSVMQVLFSLDDYAYFFKDKEFPKHVDPSKDLTSQMIKFHDGLLSGRYSKSSSYNEYQLGIKPSTFKTLIGENHPEFKTGKQQDAFEFLLYLLDKTDKEFGIELNKGFKFLFDSKTVCTICSATTFSEELMDNISVPIEDKIIDEKEGKAVYQSTSINEALKQFTSAELIEGFKCNSCNSADANAMRSSGFKSFPKSLLLSVNRIKLKNWVPIKIDVPVEVPYELNLNDYKAPNLMDGEILVTKSNEYFVPNEDAYAMLLSMGFSEEKCAAALKETGNSDAESAMNWILAHMDDVEPTRSANDDQITNLTGMGFSEKLATKALAVSNNDPNAAVEWLFNNPDDDGSLENVTSVDIDAQNKELIQELSSSTSSANYKIKSIICHKGSSPHTGHYVAFVRKLIEGEVRWVLFNDEKVVVCDDSNLEDIRNNAYIYVFERF